MNVIPDGMRCPKCGGKVSYIRSKDGVAVHTACGFEGKLDATVESSDIEKPFVKTLKGNFIVELYYTPDKFISLNIKSIARNGKVKANVS
jgi:hypothetical protein